MARLLMLCLLLSTHAMANLTLAEQDKQYKDNLGWAKSAQQGVTSTTSGHLNITDYCADATCVNDVNNPSQAGMSDAAINDQKTTAFYSDDTANAMQQNFNKGRDDAASDPAYSFALIGQENAFDITHGISNSYVDCDSGTQCLIENHPRSCKTSTLSNVPCYSEPIASVEVGITRYQCPTGWTLYGTTCHGEVEECRFDHYKNEVNVYTGAYGSQSTTYTWDGSRVNASGYRQGAPIYSNTVSCGHQGDFQCTTRKYEICGMVPAEEPASLTCDDGYTLSGAQCVKNTFTWKTDCSLLGDCNQTSQVCVEGAQTRTINGIPTYLDCWKYQVNHLCDLGDSCANLPSDCEEQSRHCSLQQNGVCIEEEVQKSCPEKQCRSTNLQCGDEIYCLDGECYDAMPQVSSDFNQAASNLAALAEAADGLGDPPMIFTGQGMKCTDKAFGFADCCKDGGWGVGIGLDECNEEEKALGQAKEQGTTIYLGKYCASKFLGACTREKKTYCVFDSKLSRIIQEQGVKGQLGIGLGSAENPICGAITPEQLQDINFEHIDFSDFYGDMHDSANLPSADEIQNRLQSAYSN